jgi:KDO2-lipid IV(A) lauroyltransferase
LPQTWLTGQDCGVTWKGCHVVYVFDQHAGKRDGIRVDFFGLAGAHIQKSCDSRTRHACSCGPGHELARGRWHTCSPVRGALPLIDCENVGEAIRRNTRLYNATLERLILRHPEQWIWMHRRWKPDEP